MTPEKAIELVGSYALLTRKIKEAKKAIGENLDKCNGISGTRNTSILFPTEEVKLDSKNRELDVHLVGWYTPETVGDDYYEGGRISWQTIAAGEHGKECPHCYAAHLAIQNRKELRKALAIVKRSMSRVKPCA